VDNYFYLNIEHYLNKFFIFLNGFIKNRSKPLIKVRFLFFKIFLDLLHYKINIRSIKNIKKLLNNKIRYLDFCYKGVSLKLFIKKR